VGVSGQEYLRHIVSNTDGTMAGGGVLDGKAMLMLANASGKTGCQDSSEVINSVDIITSTLRKDIPAQTITDLSANYFSAVALNEKSCTAVRSMSSCPGMDSCYMVYDLPLLCGNMGVFPTVRLDESTACSDSSFFAESAATVIYKAYTDSVKNNFNDAYLSTALSAASLEKFAVTYSTSEYHYTLYYYDQAGSLVKTIPPAGVVKNLRQSWADSVDVAKAANRKLVPAHTMATEYRYNSLGGIIAQKTPDAGTSQFWYDRLGRLAVSQNYKQKGKFNYSYTTYDDLGRINEVGELTSGTAMADAVSRNPVNLGSWLNNVAGSKHEITRTTYDIAYPFFTPEKFVGRNLRNRVSWTALYSIADSLSSGGHSTATFYSYDIHGNVDTLLQDYKIGKMAEAGDRFKKIAYNYDLISGNVNEVAYQAGESDAFYHRYRYDAENRITNVETSHDRVYWENDAYYDYYKHGPLARSVIGQQQVQGIDYVFTLQGWMKGINSTALTAESDPGNDGQTGSITPKDAFGFMLHYFGQDDYKPIVTDKQPFAAAAGDFKPLYNGNIGAIGQHIAGIGNPLLYNYKYDALNRLKGMQAYQGLDLSTNTWNATALEDFKESVSYDADGNILNYNRNGNHTFANQPLGMDSLRYNYRPGSNKLDWIDDQVRLENYASDIDKQQIANYAYDSIGNLVADVAAGIRKVEWTLYGKIAYIVKENNDTIHYTYDVAGNRISKSYHDTTTLYVRDASGNLLTTYVKNGDSPILPLDANLYGSSRLGTFHFEEPKYLSTLIPGLGSGLKTDFVRGRKIFELSNHLGNVLATVTDKKLVFGQGDAIHYDFDLLSATEYYPFGMQMPGRAYNSSGYRYGFNGKENDNEVNGEGNSVDFGARLYDARLARWNSVDPKESKHSGLTPYNFVLNSPNLFVDPDGQDNVIYLQVLNSAKLTPAQKNEIITRANANFATMGLKTQVRLFTGSKIEMSKIDKTDAIAILGSRQDVIKTVERLDKQFSTELNNDKDWGSEENPEISKNPLDGPNANIIAIESNGVAKFAKTMKADNMEAAAAVAINHGAGHNAGLNHGGDNLRIDVGEYIRIPRYSIMSGADDIYQQVAKNFSKTRNFKKLQDFVNSSDNKVGIIHKKYIERFGQSDPLPKVPVLPLPKK
jgi:RHS repeat-associated protein